MDFANWCIMLALGLVLLSILSIFLSQRFGIPILLVFLAIGMLAGTDGPGHIEYNNFPLTYIIGSMALAVILFDGGLHTSREALKLSLGPAALLATLGVVLTAGLMAAGAYFFLDIKIELALLLGAIVASTDAAAVFFLLRQKKIGLHPRLKATLEIESGMNDPAAVLLVTLCAEMIMHGNDQFSVFDAVRMAFELLAGAAAGAGFGGLLLLMIRRTHLSAGLYPVMAVSGVLFVFGLTEAAGASGFIAAYVMGIVLGATHHRARRQINNFTNGMAWTSQIVMFLLLGLLASPSAMMPHLWPAFVIAMMLMFVARPLAVIVCLAPFRYNWREIAFVAWVGLRGAVPIYLATVPVLLGIDNSITLFSVIFVVVILSLMCQGWTIGPVARLLKLDRAEKPQGPDVP